MALTEVRTVKERLAAALAVLAPGAALPFQPDQAAVGERGLFVVLDAAENVVELMTAGGWDQISLVVRVYLPRTNEERSQQVADGYRASSGPGSVKALLEGDRTLGGVARSVIVRPPEGLATAQIGATDHLTVDWPVEVLVA